MLFLKPIKFEIHNRKYNLKFNSASIMQITGDACSGKSLFFSDFKEYLSDTHRLVSINDKVVVTTTDELINEMIKST